MDKKPQESKSDPQHLRLQREAMKAARDRDAGRLLDLQYELKILESERAELRRKEAQEAIAGLRTRLAELSLLGLAAAAALASLAPPENAPVRNLYALAGVFFAVSTLTAIIPHAWTTLVRRDGDRRTWLDIVSVLSLVLALVTIIVTVFMR